MDVDDTDRGWSGNDDRGRDDPDPEIAMGTTTHQKNTPNEYTYIGDFTQDLSVSQS